MRALLDVNVLIALLDAAHLHHRSATAWLSDNALRGWASCPLTQNGCVRIMSLVKYPNHQPVDAVASRLRAAIEGPQHRFWPDDISLLDPTAVDTARTLTSRQLTDAYLLALAVAHGGRLVTFDQRVASAAVPGARSEHLVII